MEQMDKIEFLREKAGCTYTEARAALEMSQDDLLDALCWLEQHGKTTLSGACCSTEDRAPDPEPQPEASPRQESGPFVQGFQYLWEGIVGLLRAGCRNHLVMTNGRGEQEFSIPVLLFVILLIPAFSLIAVLMIVALFCGCRFSFRGEELGKEPINDAMGKATDFAGDLKQEFTEKL